MAKWIDLAGPVLANSVYSGSTLVGRDATCTLPSITFQTSEFNAMGKMALPLAGMIEQMELSITKAGFDLGMVNLMTPGSKSIELRWVGDTLKADGSSKKVAYKAFFVATPLGIPGIGLTPGEVGDNELTFAVTRYRLIRDGVEVLLIDRLAGIFKVNGKDHAAALTNSL